MSTPGAMRREGYDPHARIRMWFEISWRFQEGQTVRAQDIVDEYGVSRRTAERWLQQLALVTGIRPRAERNPTCNSKHYVWGFNNQEEEKTDGMD